MNQGLIEVYTFINGNYETKRDNTYINGSKYMDTVLTIRRLIEFLDRSKITNFNKILFTND